MKLLITGCHGFLGQSIGAYALASGMTVMGVSRRESPPLNWQGGQHICANLAEDSLAELITEFDPDVIFHAAGSSSVAQSLAAPREDFQKSVDSWSRLLEAVRISERAPIIFLPSSAAVYGEPGKEPIEESSPKAPISPYGYNKLCSELLAESYAQIIPARIVCIRLFSLFGPQQKRLFLWEIFQQAQKGVDVVEIKGTGTEKRDYLHIDDLSNLILQLAETAHARPVPLFLNVGSGETLTTASAAEQIVHCTGSHARVVCRGLKLPGNPACWTADLTLLQSIVPGWKPAPFSNRLQTTVDNWKNGDCLA